MYRVVTEHFCMKKALKIIGNVLTVLIAALAVIMTIFTIFSMVMGRDGQVSLFGVKGYIVQSDSMRPEFAAGDVIFSTDVEAEELAMLHSSAFSGCYRPSGLQYCKRGAGRQSGKAAT